MGGRAVIVCRTGYTGERGYEVLPTWGSTPRLWDALLEAAQQFDGLPCGLGARDTLRTEMGYPLHGNDLGPDITPVMALSGWAVGWDKDTFWGKEAVSEQRAAKTSTARDWRGVLLRLPGADRRGRRRGGDAGTFSPTLRGGSPCAARPSASATVVMTCAPEVPPMSSSRCPSTSRSARAEEEAAVSDTTPGHFSTPTLRR